MYTMSSLMDKVHENEEEELNLNNNIITLVDDGNGNYRQNVSIYNLLIELEVQPTIIPKNITDFMCITYNKSFTIKDFSVEIIFIPYGGHLCGYVKEYSGDNKDWMNMDKYYSITDSEGEFTLTNNKEIYIPHGGFTHYNM